MLKLIKFSAEWCAPCRMLEPIFAKVESTVTDVSFETVDIDENPMRAQQMGVAAVPTIIIEKDGKVVDSLVGLQREAAILNAISKWK
jgi:thioredoxin 1